MSTKQNQPSAQTFTQTQAQMLFDACNSVIKHRDCCCESGFPVCSVCLCRRAVQQVAEQSAEAAPLEEISPEQFMAFFRSDEFHEQMSDEDCRELFAFSLKGASDFTVEFLNEIFCDYSVAHLDVVSIDETKTP